MKKKDDEVFFLKKYFFFKAGSCVDQFMGSVTGGQPSDRMLINIWRTFMRFQSKTLFAAALLVAVGASAAMAASPTGQMPLAVPGPVAGAGLGYLLLAGGYYVVRRWPKQNTGE